MNTFTRARRSVGRLLLTAMLLLTLLPFSGLSDVGVALAAYVPRFNTITNGAMTFTGNTLGLSKQTDANAPGTRDGIGTFITTNTALADATYPAGTTANWALNMSSANLTMPAGSTVLRAELIWSGSYSYGQEDVSAFLDNAVSFSTPAGQTFNIAPDPVTARTLGTKGANGICASDPNGTPVVPCFYVRSADVTAQVQAAGAGAYTTGKVPATQGNLENTRNNAGWTLAVAYSNLGLPARNLSLFVGAELTNSDTSTPVTVSGFCTPTSPAATLSGRLLLSATEGDANRIGDQMKFGPTDATLSAISGPNNLANNFFASQINNDAGALSTGGTFGTRNETPSTTEQTFVNLSGGRQGWDITNVDISGQLIHDQRSAVAQGTSAGDQYVINALGTQIEVGAPKFPTNVTSVDKAQTYIGDTLTYTILVNNTGTADALNLVFKDAPPAGTSFIPGSFAIDGSAQSGADPSIGVNMGTIALGTRKTVTFKVRVDSFPVGAPIKFDNSANWNYQYISCTDQPALNGALVTNQVTTLAPLLNPSKSVTPIGAVSAGQQLTYSISIPNSGSAASIGTTLADSVPAGTSYVAGSTTLNGAAVADVGGAMPFTNARLVNSAGAPAGQIAPGATATVQFKVIVKAGVTAAIQNIATVDPDGPGGPIPPANVQTFNPVVQLAATKSAALVSDIAPTGGSPGDTIEYTINVANSGSGSSTGTMFNDAIPANTSYVAGSTTLNGAALPDVAGGMPFVSGQLINSPGAAAGQIATGGSATITFRVIINNPIAAGVTQISNQGTVSSNEIPPVPTDDPRTPPPNDPTITPITAAPALAADKSVKLQTDADGNGVPSPGDTLRYTVAIVNSGNATATGVTFTDTPDANTTLVAGSVSASQGTITSGNTGTPPITVNIGTIAGQGGSVTLTFDVRVKNPLPAGVHQVANQGVLGSKELPAVPTNDPSTPAPNDPTITPILAAPVLKAAKQATLLLDADKNGVVSPGDTLLYEITIRNSGNTAATGVTYSDTPDANTTLVAGSVQTNAGTITGGNTGAPPVTVSVGTIPGLGGTAIISYRVTVNQPLPAGVNQVVNQGIVGSNELPPVPTDDPKNPSGGPTIVPVVASPALVSTKTDILLIDADKNGLPSPGDSLLYVIDIRNNGNAGASDVLFSDVPDSNTTLVAGSVQTSLGTVTKGNGAGDRSIGIMIGALSGGGAKVAVSFVVTINSPLPAGVTQVVNQGIISGGNFPSILTDDPETPQPSDPTITPLAVTPQLDVVKSSNLFKDVDKDGVVSPGDIVQYTVVVRNAGNGAATGVKLSDTPDKNTTLVVGSVQTSQGAVAGGNSAGDTTINADIGTLSAGSVAIVSYQVVINKPLPAGIREIINQAVVCSTNSPCKPSNAPDYPGPTKVPVVAAPVLQASKLAKLFTDADNNGFVSPGDTLLYQVTIKNNGNAAASGLAFSDILDQNVALQAGSIQTSQGTVTTPATVTNSVSVDIGTLAAGGSVVISFRVTINNPLAAGVTEVVNQGVITGGNIPSVPTDDPSTPQPGDPTITPVVAAPRLTADKAASLLVDADKNGVPSAGDTLLYDILIQNSGNTAATGVTFSDTPDSNTTLVAGSVQVSQGSVTGGNAGTPPVTADIGTLPAGARVSLTFQVTINNPLPAGVTQLVNQGTVNATGLPPLLTNDPKTPPAGDPTITPVAAAPLLTADKTDILLIDANHSGSPSAGDTLLYIVSIANAGNVAATNVVFNDTPDTKSTRLVAGSVQTNLGTVTKGNTAGDTSLSVAVGTLPAGARVTISFQAKINDALTTSTIINQGTTTSTGQPPLPTNDPDTPEPNDPTYTIIPPGQSNAVTLASFTASRAGSTIVVRWVTTLEVNTWGFALYRSADGTRSSAIRVTPELIASRGRGQGAVYSWTDRAIQPGIVYTYWLQETELNGTVNQYGPATATLVAASPHAIFVPFAMR